MSCENGLCIKFKTKTQITLSSRQGKPHVITIQPYEFIDIDVKTGRFFVKNKFTNSKMKLVDANDETHYMDLSRVKNFISSSRESKTVDIWT